MRGTGHDEGVVVVGGRKEGAGQLVIDVGIEDRCCGYNIQVYMILARIKISKIIPQASPM